MHLIRWETLLPVDELYGDNLPPLERVGWDLAVDIYECKNRITVEMQMAGVKKDGYTIKMEENIMVVRGEREKSKKTEAEGENCLRREIQRGKFIRQTVLPENEYDSDSMKAELKNGILTVTIEKA